nr:MAG: structural protein [Totiviridae sp.]
MWQQPMEPRRPRRSPDRRRDISPGFRTFEEVQEENRRLGFGQGSMANIPPMPEEKPFVRRFPRSTSSDDERRSVSGLEDSDTDSEVRGVHRARVATSSTEGLRHICNCDEEVKVRALYLRRARCLRASRLWRERGRAWIGEFLMRLSSYIPRDGHPDRGAYLGLWGYTLTCGFEKLAPGEELDYWGSDRCAEVMGLCFEHTEIRLPPLTQAGVLVNYQQFKEHQRVMREHVSSLYGRSDVEATEVHPDLSSHKVPLWGGETLSPPGAPANTSDGESTQVASDRSSEDEGNVTVVEVASTAPVSPGPTMDALALGAEVEVAAVGATEVEPEQTTPKEVEAVEEADLVPATISGGPPPPEMPRERRARKRKKRPPGRVVVHTRVFTATVRQRKRAGAPAGERRTEGTRNAGASQGRVPPMDFPPPRDPDREYAKPYRPVEPLVELRDTLFEDDGPAEEVSFEEAAGCREASEDHVEQCCHDEFRHLRRRMHFSQPQKYCQCVKAAAAAEVVRHPSDWGLSAESIQVFGAMAARGILSDRLIAKEPYRHRRLQVEDKKPAQDIQSRYAVEVKNRFAPLIDDDELTLELDEADIGEVVRETAHQNLRRGRKPPPSAGEDAPNRERKVLADQASVRRKAGGIDYSKSREQRKRDGRAALQRIAKRISAPGVKPKDVALTVIEGDPSPAVSRLLEEQHPWLRSAQEAKKLGKWCWLAACIHNHVSQDVTLTGIFRMTKRTCELTLTGPTEWVRDLTADGDVERNPGPVSYPSTMAELKAMLPYDEWLRQTEGLGATMLTDSVRYAAEESRPADIRNISTNGVLVSEGWWFPGVAGQASSRLKFGTWSTQLYPTTLSSVRRREFYSWRLSVPQGSDSWIPTKGLNHQVPVDDEMYARDAPGVGADVDQYAAARQIDQEEAGDSEGESESAESEEEVLNQPAAPDLVLASIRRSGRVNRSSGACGGGTVVPVRGEGLRSRLEEGHAGAVVVGRSDDRTVSYAAGKPVVYYYDKKLKQSHFRIGGRVPPEEVQQEMEVLTRSGGPEVPMSETQTAKVVGVWYPLTGNGATASLSYRAWGPPIVAFGARAVPGKGTSVSPTVLCSETGKDLTTRLVIVPRMDIVSTGLDKTTAEKMALSPPPTPTTCEALALKMGLMLSWARYGQRQASEKNVFTGQAQVHEPSNRVVAGGKVVRIVNSSGLPREDCGGLTRPCFPFMGGSQRGRIRFFSSATLIPPGEAYIVLPSCFEREVNFMYAAVFIMAHLPWPWGNLSLVVDTQTGTETEAHGQIFTWFGSTTTVPGELYLNIVLHQVTAVDGQSGRGGQPVLPLWPTTGGTAVEHWPPYGRIPVNHRRGDTYFICASSFAVSWAMSYGVETVRQVLANVTSCGLWNKVERWVNEGPVWISNHAGILTTGRAQACHDPGCSPEPMQNTPVQVADDTVPTLFRCWAAPGNRLPQIPGDVVWDDWDPEAAWRIDLPDLVTLSFVYAGFWKFDEPMGTVGLAVDDRLLCAVEFIAAERLFMGWHILHARAGIPIDAFMRSDIMEDHSKGERQYFRTLFGGGEGDPREAAGVVDSVLTQALRGNLLTTANGTRVLDMMMPPRLWEPQVIGRLSGQGEKTVCPTPVTDLFMFKYLPSVPRELAPFVVTNQDLANKDYLQGEPQARPPPGYFGPFIYGQSGEYDYVDFRDVVLVAEESWWQNRLMHTTAEYVLSRYRDAEVVPDGLDPGHAPIMVVRGSDDWSGYPIMLQSGAWPYPFFSSQWSGWLTFDDHSVTTLMSPGREEPWVSMLNTGIRGKSAGVTFDPSKPPYPVQAGSGDLKGRNLKKFLALAGNEGRGGSGGSTLKSLGDEHDPPSSAGGKKDVQTTPASNPPPKKTSDPGPTEEAATE